MTYDFDDNEDDADFAFRNGEYNNESDFEEDSFVQGDADADEGMKEFHKALNGDYSEEDFQAMN